MQGIEGADRHRKTVRARASTGGAQVAAGAGGQAAGRRGDLARTAAGGAGRAPARSVRGAFARAPGLRTYAVRWWLRQQLPKPRKEEGERLEATTATRRPNRRI